jgi:hypothetical protein
MKFISAMMAIIFTLMSLVEIIAGFHWEYRILNLIAIGFWYAYWRLRRPPMIIPLHHQKLIPQTDAI